MQPPMDGVNAAARPKTALAFSGGNFVASVQSMSFLHALEEISDGKFSQLGDDVLISTSSGGSLGYLVHANTKLVPETRMCRQTF